MFEFVYDEKYSAVERFFLEREKNLNNPLIRNFLKDKRNYQLVVHAIKDPSTKNKKIVEEEFKKYYKKIVKKKYMSKLIHFYSIDFDKRNRKIKERYLLYLDNKISENNSSSFKDALKSEVVFDKELYESLYDVITNKKLLSGLKTLTDNQLLILELIYLKGLKQIEVAKMLKTSPQNISNQHRKSINKLRKIMKE